VTDGGIALVLRRLWKSPALRVTFWHGCGGVAWAAANLLLARALSPAEYGRFALILALTQIGGSIGPLGADMVVKRRPLAPNSRLLVRTSLTSGGAGLVVAFAARVFYGIDAWLALIVITGCLVGGLNMVASAEYQGQAKFGPSLVLAQGQAAMLITAAALSVVIGARDADGPAAIYVACYGLLAAGGWLWLRYAMLPQGLSSDPVPWSDAVALLAFQSAMLILVQLDRLVIPRLLSVSDLATFAVLAAIVGSPLRMLHLGVGYTLIPRLRGALTVYERRRLVVREAILVGLVSLLVCVAIWAATPVLVRSLLHGKYDLSAALVLAALVTGLWKVVEAFASSAATAMGEAGELTRLAIGGWGALALGAVGGAVGARWGLVGVVYGIGLGWLVRAIVGAIIAWPHFHGVEARRWLETGT